MHVTPKLQHELLAVESEHDIYGMVELEVPDVTPEPGDVRPALRLALVIDRSGSMGGEKLDTVKRCAHYLVDRMKVTDELALVTYDDTVSLVSGLAPVQPSQLHLAIDGIYAGGMTNLSGGWLKGREELFRRADGTRRVLLLTDGLANEGITEPDQLVGLTRQASGSGVSTTTIGVGDGFNEELLTGMGQAGQGGAWFAESVEDAPGIFADEFDDLVALFAQNVSVEIRPTAEVEVAGILNEYPATVVDGGIQALVGDVYGGQRVRVVFRLHIPQLAGLGVQQVADIVLRYVTVGETVEAHELTLPVTVNAVTADEAAGASADEDVTDEVTVILAARATDEARRLADSGDTDAAADILREAAQDLQAVAPRSDRSAALNRQAEDLLRTVDEIQAVAYGPASSKRLHYRSHEMKNRRRNRDDQ